MSDLLSKKMDRSIIEAFLTGPAMEEWNELKADAVILDQEIVRLERIIHAFDIQGLKSWAQAIIDEWHRGERDYSACKVAQKIIAGLAATEEKT